MKRILRWIAIGVSGVLLLFVLAIVAVLIFLRTDTGAAWVEATLNRSLSSPDQTIRIDGLAGALPLHWQVRQIEVADREGTWLRVADAVVDIDAGALFAGTARIDVLSAGSIDVLRGPIASAAPPPEPAAPTPWKTVSLPRLPLAIELGKLSVPRIALAPSLAGEAATLSVDGEAALHEGTGHVRLTVARTDPGGAGNLDLRADYGPPPGGGPEQLDLALHVAEPSGTLLAPLSPTGDKLPLRVDLTGKGPLAAWTGRLDGAAGPAATILAALTISRHDTDFSLAAKGSLHGAALMGDAVKPAVGDDVEFGYRRHGGGCRVNRARSRPCHARGRIALGAGTLRSERRRRNREARRRCRSRPRERPCRPDSGGAAQTGRHPLGHARPAGRGARSYRQQARRRPPTRSMR